MALSCWLLHLNQNRPKLLGKSGSRMVPVPSYSKMERAPLLRRTDMRRLVPIVFLLISTGLYAQDKKISELPSGSPAQLGDALPIARAGANYRLAGSDFCLVGNCT